MRTIEWDHASCQVKMIDQRLLPGELRILRLNTPGEIEHAIRTMAVRGAPAIGAAAAFGLALAGYRSDARSPTEWKAELLAAAEKLQTSRPTAVNLSWGLQRVLRSLDGAPGTIDELRRVVLQEAQKLADEDVEINRRMAMHGSELLKDGDTVIHHCNTGALATVDWGTALGVIRMTHEQGKRIHVLVDETRPRLQGARLTAWELQQYGISFDVISDNAAGHFLQRGAVQCVLFGGDRMAANGDVANKIGSYMLALAANDNQVPVYSVVPTSTIDLNLAHGGLIPIEERPPEEVLGLQVDSQPVFPSGVSARNPAFDVTPARLLSGIITEAGVLRPPYEPALRNAVMACQPRNQHRGNL
jgi:methylthioribose-1-phosphate isomerase